LTPRWLRAVAVLVVCGAASAAWAHVGSPIVTAAGNAGPYELVVMIGPPARTPGLATIEIAAADDDVAAVRLSMAPVGAPTSGGAAAQVRRSASHGKASFAAEVWLDSAGPWRLEIAADGVRGAGTMSVAVPAPGRIGERLATVVTALRIALALGLALLMGGAVRRRGRHLAGAARGRHLAGAARGRAHGGAARGRDIAGAALATLAFVAVAIKLGRFPPPAGAAAALDVSVAAGRLSLRVPSLALLPDHGHLVHLFLVRVPGLDGILHLHPSQGEDGRFVEDLPGGAAGRYQVYADVVDASGAPATFVGEVELPAAPGRPLAGDDAAGEGPPIAGADPRRTIASLSDGARVRWRREGGPLRRGRLVTLTFLVEDPHGVAVDDLQPYMGMLGHAIVLRHDRAVFAHVHPTGSVPMASSAALGGGDAAAPHHACAPTAGASSVTFPYAFPSAGAYRIFVQLKRHDRIETAVFDAEVEE
jgi:hypothetical protein